MNLDSVGFFYAEIVNFYRISFIEQDCCFNLKSNGIDGGENKNQSKKYCLGLNYFFYLVC